MESQRIVREADGANSSVLTSGIPPVAGTAISGQGLPIPPALISHGFHGAGNQLPFLYSHSYMPPIPGFGFSAPAQGTPSATIDLTEGSPKRGPKETVIDLSKLAKKRRAPRKKPEIVELDDGKEDVELLRNAHHWRDHWVIQLISLRGEMQNTFNAPPKQGAPIEFHNIFEFFSVLSVMLLGLGMCTAITTCLLTPLNEFDFIEYIS